MTIKKCLFDEILEDVVFLFPIDDRFSHTQYCGLIVHF